MAGEALSHVQGKNLKGSAIVFRRFLNSPVTSSNVGGRYRNKRGVYRAIQEKAKASVG
jgi:hypothetical protein